MAVRQYIGARYVPVFFDNNGSTEWVGNHAYEPLTIVTYLGNSYTSKKPVPADTGNPSANPEFWASTGIYNSQVEEYKQEVLAVEAHVSELSSDVSDLSDAVDDVSGDVSNVASDLANYETANDARSTAIENSIASIMEGKKYLLIGDSYALTGHGDWAGKLRTQLLTYGASRVDIKRDSGAGFINGEFLSLLTDYVTQNPTLAAKVTDVVVIGGANDSTNNVNSLATAIPAFVTYARSNLPALKNMWLGYVGWINNNSSVFAQRTPSYQRQCYAYYTNKAIHGMDYLNGITMAIRNVDLINADGIHPNSAGGDAIASSAFQCLVNGYSTIARFDNVNQPTPVNDGTISGTFYQSITGDMVVLRHGEITITWGAANAVTIGNSWVTILNGVVMPYSLSLSRYSEPCIWRNSVDSIWRQGNFYFRVTGAGELQAQYIESETASAWKSLRVSALRISPNTIMFDGILATA